MRLLHKALVDGSFLLDLEARDFPSIFRQTVNQLVGRGLITTEQRDLVVTALLTREEQASTAIGHAVAVPHAYLDAVTEPVIVFVRLARPLNLGASDGIPTRFLFVLMGPPEHAAEHLDALTNIARLMADEEFRYDAGEARSQRDLIAAFKRFTARMAPPPAAPGEKVPESLRYTGRLFGGLVEDVRRRWPHYVSDFRDGLHPKCLSSTLFLFFACVAPAVTFGGVMAELTGNTIGVVEMIVASAFCGVVYALVAGQPLIILGGTGPLLIFTMILYEFCVDLSLPFLETRAWVGLWTALLLFILAATDASCLLRYFTRFTDEIFAMLIAMIFIFAAVEALTDIFDELDVKQHHDTALLSLLLALGTFYIAKSLTRFRHSRYLLPQIREFLADFGPTIAMVLMTLVAVWFSAVDLDKLPAPDSLRPTFPPAPETARPWLVNLFDAPSWVWLAALAPALLVVVLVYVDQNITARLVNNADHKLQKGEAYHFDLAVMGVLIGVCSLFGLPWLVAATVRSLSHLRSLATVEEVVTPTGDTRERVIHVRETRVTGLAIHLLIGLSLLLLPVLQMIPMAVLYGLFLFMGVISIAGNQFFERLTLWPMDSSLYPTTHYIRKVPLPTIHKFTVLQLVCLGMLGLVEISRIGILFPLFVVLLIPIRLLAGRYFAPEHLAALDADEEPEEEELQWV